jgi:UPF0716 protein FxsA
MWLFLIFVGVPILEIGLFIQVGGVIGLWPTLAIVVLTALAGTLLVRIQGLQALARLQESLERGGDPVQPIAHGALILVAGILLLTPGFFTDSLGLALLIPPVRAAVIGWGAARFAVQGAAFVRRGPRPGPGPRPAPRGETIDADYEIVDEGPPPRRRGSSGWTRPEG